MKDMEQAVIVSCMIDSDAAATLDLAAEHFSSEAGQIIWDHILRAVSMGDPIDGLTMQEKLRDKPEVLLAFGAAMNTPGSPKNIHWYADQVKQDFRRRELKRVANVVISDTDTPIDELTSEVMSEILRHESGGKRADFNASQLMAKTLERIDSAASGAQLGLKTGWRSLDKKLGGWHKGDLTVVAGRPGMGKSAFGMNAVINAAKLGASVGFVSVEMDAVSLGMRIAASEAGVSITSLRTGTLTPQEFDKVVSASNKIAKLPLRILDAPSWTMGQIIRQCHAWHRSGLDFVVIDYLQRTRPDKDYDRHDLAIGQMAKDCKTMASVLEMPVMLLSQLSRNLESRQDKRPQMSDLRESGQIEQEADNIIMLYRESVYNEAADDHEAEVLVEKQRQGPIGTIPMLWEGARSLWKDGEQAWNN